MRTPPRLPQPLPAAALALATVALPAAPAAAEVRQGSFESAALGRSVSYVVDLPDSYEGSDRLYPVVYALHGLFEGEGFWERRGLARELARLRESGPAADLIVVAVDGGNSFFLNGPSGRYEDMVADDLVAHVEATWRVVPGREGRALLGVSRGGYAALRMAFTRPDRFAAVATHSAMILETIPSAAAGARRGHMRAFHGAFGDPIDEELWRESDPLTWAPRVDPATAPALYLDCGAQDRYGLARGHRALDRLLTERGVAHTFELPPGDHGYEFVRGRLPISIAFLSAALEQAPRNPRSERRGGPSAPRDATSSDPELRLDGASSGRVRTHLRPRSCATITVAVAVAVFPEASVAE